MRSAESELAVTASPADNLNAHRHLIVEGTRQAPERGITPSVGRGLLARSADGQYQLVGQHPVIMRAYSPIAGAVGGDVASPSGLTVIRLIDVPRFNHPNRAIPRADPTGR